MTARPWQATLSARQVARVHRATTERHSADELKAMSRDGFSAVLAATAADIYPTIFKEGTEQ